MVLCLLKVILLRHELDEEVGQSTSMAEEKHIGIASLCHCQVWCTEVCYKTERTLAQSPRQGKSSFSYTVAFSKVVAPQVPSMDGTVHSYGHGSMRHAAGQFTAKCWTLHIQKRVSKPVSQSCCLKQTASDGIGFREGGGSAQALLMDKRLTSQLAQARPRAILLL